MKKFAVHFDYDSGISRSLEVAIVFAEDKEGAARVFNNNIRKVFSYNEDTCTISFVSQLPDDVSLVYTKGGSYWAK